MKKWNSKEKWLGNEMCVTHNLVPPPPIINMEEQVRKTEVIVFILLIFVYHISSSRNIQVMLKDIFQDSSKLRRKLLKTCLEGIWKWVKSTKHLASKTQKKSLGIWFFFKISKFIIFFNKKKYKVSLYFYLRGSTFYIEVIAIICF